MAIKKSEIYSKLWKLCDELRGGMEASEYKDYILVLLFVKYVSDKYNDKKGLIEIPKKGSFQDMVALIGKPEIGEEMDKIIANLAEANGLKGIINNAYFNDESKLGKGKAMVDRLSNLIGITDRNYIQIDGNTEDVMPLDPLDKKYEAFNWNVKIIDGHDMKQIIKVLKASRTNKGKPLMIIANTIPGKGVDFMEGKFEWHGKPPKPDEAELALEEIHAHEVEERGDWVTKHNKWKPIHK